MTDAQVMSAITAVVLLGSLSAALLAQKPADPLPDAEPLEWNGHVRRKRDARRFNERVKLFATFLNNLGLAVIVTALLGPAFQDASVSGSRIAMVVLLSVAVQLLAQFSLRLWKSEE